MAAVLSSELGNADKVSHFIDEALAMGIPVLGPDVNESGESFTPVIHRPAEGRPSSVEGQQAAAAGPAVDSRPSSLVQSSGIGDPGVAALRGDATPPSRESGKIRFGLAAIKGVGEVAARKIIAEREARGPYRDFRDFLLRVDTRAINKRVLECLVLTGAFDSTGATREELFDDIDASLGVLGELQRKYPALRREEPDAARPPVPSEAMLFDLAATSVAAAPPDPAALATEFAGLHRVTVARRNWQRRRPGPAETVTASTRSRSSGAPAWPPARLQARGRPSPQRPSAFSRRPRGSNSRRNCSASTSRAIRWTRSTASPPPSTPCPRTRFSTNPTRASFALCGVATGITKKLSRKDNRPWAAFTLATRRAALPMNMFSEAYEAYAKNLIAETPVLVQGTVLAGGDGVRLNVRECYALGPAITSLIRKVTWLLRPEHPDLIGFLNQLRAIVHANPGVTRLEFAFLFADRAAPFAAPPSSLGWSLEPGTFRELRAHPAVAGTIVETKRLQLKETRRRGQRG